VTKKNTEVQEFRSSGVQEFRSSGVQEFRSSGVQKNSELGTLLRIGATERTFGERSGFD
jgi:hypothetical protein